MRLCHVRHAADDGTFLPEAPRIDQDIAVCNKVCWQFDVSQWSYIAFNIPIFIFYEDKTNIMGVPPALPGWQ